MFSVPRKLAAKVTASRFFSTFEKILKSFDPTKPLEAAPTIPNSWYTSEEFYQKEIEHIWKKNWLLVDSCMGLKENGEFRTGEIIEQPYIISKSDSGINAFYNVCLHHGAVIEPKPAGKCDQIKCNYHGWTYGLDGKLIKCSAMKGSQNFNMKEQRLKPINSYQYGTFFYLNFQENALKDTTEFEGMLKTFDKHHTNYKFDPLFKNYTYVTEQDYVMNCNWKIFVDNWLDGGYHVAFLHHQLTKEVTIKQFTSTNYHKTNYQEAPGESERIGDHLIYSYIYPNTMISTYRPWIDVTTIKPLGVNKCLVKMKWLVSDERKNDTKFIQDSIAQSKSIQDEDVMMSELVQKGMKSDGFKTGRYSPKMESGINEFHKALYHDLVKAL